MMKQDKTGKQSESFTKASTSRRINLEADINLVKKNDEYPSKRIPIFYVLFIILLLSIFSCIVLLKNGNLLWSIAIGVITLLLLLAVYIFNNPLLIKRLAYENGILIPAIITNTSPLEIVAMADMRIDKKSKPRWGLIKLNIKNIPFHPITIGEKIPCVSLFGTQENGYLKYFEPRPVSWGFDDPKIITEAINKINEVIELTDYNKVNEWELLEALTDIMKNQPYNKVLFVNKNLNVDKQ